MNVRRLSRIEDLSAIANEWRELCARDPNATPFNTPDWLLPWWDVFGSGELFSFAVEDQGALVALAPMFLHPWNGRRQVTFIGNGVSDRLGFIALPQHADAASNAILDAIAAERDRWDLCDLQDLSCGSTLYRANPARLHAALRPQYPGMAIPLPESWEEYHSALPHGLRRNLHRYRNHLDREGNVRFETSRSGEAFDALVALHRARWTSKHQDGMVPGAAFERFHKQAALNLAARGIARLHVMRVDESIVAVAYVLLYRAIVYGYLTGFDPALARFSPGALVLEYSLRESIREGARVYDFLRGDEAYKRDWGAHESATYRLLLWHDRAPVDLLEAA